MIHGYAFCEIVIDDQEFCERGKYKSELSLPLSGVGKETMLSHWRVWRWSLWGVMDMAPRLCPSKSEMRAKCEERSGELFHAMSIY